MKKLCLSFFEFDSDYSFAQMAQSLGGKITNGAIRMPADSGSGIIKKVKLEEGVYIRVWDLKLNSAMIFEKMQKPGATKKKTFQIAYLLNPETLILKRKGSKKKFKIPRGMNTLFISDDAEITFEIEAEQSFQMIDLSVAYSWLLDAFKDKGASFVSFITELNEMAQPTNFFESSSASEYRILDDLYNSGLQESRDFLHVRSDVRSLLSDFFNKILTRSANKVSGSKIVDYEKMLQVEKILIAHIERTLPGVYTIARQMAMSESTLKRHFKLMFDKNIYEYYLEMKMDFARRLLLETPMTVNEVATRLDYEKANNFIDMFRQHHGISPGTLRRKSA